MGGPAKIDGKRQNGTDNFLHAPMVIDGVTWPTCEHYFQAAKFMQPSANEDTLRHIETIRKAWSGGSAWQLGQNRSYPLRSDWEQVKASVMYRAVVAKYAQHPVLAAELIETTGPISAAPSTADWQRTNGLILERVREELRPPEQRDEARLDRLVRILEPHTAPASLAQAKEAVLQMAAAEPASSEAASAVCSAV